MAILIVGLVIFLGGHSVRIFAEPWRSRQVAALGEMRWKALYSVVSIVGLALLIWGFVLARAGTPILWSPPMALHYVTAVLVLLSFVLFVAAYVPGSWIKAKLGHPLTLSVKTWAFAHLLSAGSLADVVLFGAFLAWAVAAYRAARRRDRAAAAAQAATRLSSDALAVVIGALAWVGFALRLHQSWIGVAPF